jgi:hypothetical protein
VADLVDRYTNEVAAAKPFGRNKTAVLAMIRALLGDETRPTGDLYRALTAL